MVSYRKKVNLIRFRSVLPGVVLVTVLAAVGAYPPARRTHSTALAREYPGRGGSIRCQKIYKPPHPRPAWPPKVGYGTPGAGHVITR